MAPSGGHSRGEDDDSPAACSIYLGQMREMYLCTDAFEVETRAVGDRQQREAP